MIHRELSINFVIATYDLSGAAIVPFDLNLQMKFTSYL